MTVAKMGNPHGKTNPKLTQVSVKLDPDTLKMLGTLEQEHGPNVRGRRASVLRKAIVCLYEATQVSRGDER